MKILSLVTVCALAFFWTACEKQPLDGDPAPGEHAAHGAEKREAKAAGDAKPEEAPKTPEQK